jgi:hypothetical protein
VDQRAALDEAFGAGAGDDADAHVRAKDADAIILPVAPPRAVG